MYIKKLDILGFKSFANKTRITFSNGITAIVGPNGCGKTNILDALRWVLGEQKVSLLRGSKMEEVIFNGTRDMKPLGMSEVSLTLVNNKGILPTEYHEVQITRRLFRSGESEYLMNKIPCRLKDIHELFYDTGMGAHSYSVIQQDMIEAVISDKAEERRFLFEEAAGITKYKQRKKAALRKLEATENDFLRLHDIFSEVQTQVRSLRRQQKKAERYQQIASEIKAWELYLSSTRAKTIEQERRELRASLDSLTDELTGKDASLDRFSSELEIDRKEQIDVEQSLSRIGNEIYEITEKAHSLEKEISVLREKKSNAALTIERNNNDIEGMKRRSESLTNQQAEAEEVLQRQQEEFTGIESDLADAERMHAEADSRLHAARSAKESENTRLIELEGKLSSGRTEEDNLKRQEDELSESLDAVRRQIESSSKRRSELSEERERRYQTLESISSARREAEQREKDLNDRLEDLISQGDDLSDEAAGLSASIEACQARKHLLEDMILQYEGYESGVKAAMDVQERWPDVYGTVADKFVPNPGLELAVEASLGDIAKFLICRDRKTAENIIAYLKKSSKGRIGILVPSTGMLNPVVKRPDLNSPGFIGWLDTLVTTDEELAPLMRAVLSTTAVFESGFRPDDILERLPYGFKAVSKSGDVYTRNSVSGGSDDTLSLFRRHEKIAEQERLIEESRRQLAEAKDKKNRITAEIGSVRAELGTLADEVQSLSDDQTEAQSKYNDIEYELRGIETELGRLEREKRHFSDKLETIRNRQYTLGLDFTQLSNQKQDLVSSMAEASEKLGDFETQAGQALARVSSLQVRMVEARSRTEHTESKLRHLLEIQQEINLTSTAKSEENERLTTDISASDQRVSELEILLKETFDLRHQMSEQQRSLRDRQSEILQRTDSKESQLREFRQSRDSINQHIHKLEIRLNTLESEAGSIRDRIREEYDLDIASVDTSKPNDDMTDEQARAYLHETREQLKNFGAVNLLALDEYKAASEREAFLSEQIKDLTTAKTELQDTIKKINHTARQLFSETFERVRVNFKNLFVELFTGGEADIRLVDPSDPLESDIEIIARPRGKKLLSITMMSGGERALTAISLLFSLYLVKPSPFCILDEIDAPLDDANCQRFLKIIRKFSEQTQFIIITHNKITMEAADNLYGVTMEQFGVSKLVAVKFSSDAQSPDELIVIESDESDEIEDELLESDNGNSGNGNGNGHNAEVKFETAEQITAGPAEADLNDSSAEPANEEVAELSTPGDQEHDREA